MITINHVSKTFHTKQNTITALKNCSLTIQDGEIFGIIGYSGAGKSTLIRLINQLEKQDTGHVYIDGKDLASLSKKEMKERRMKIGMIFQHFNLLWSRTVKKNIALPLEIAKVDKTTREQKVNDLIALVGLEGKEYAYPSQLSGGQKQRIGIARALANDPSILLCDEATSALDPETTETILDLLVTINKKLGLTNVLITHKMEVAQKICHRIAFMSEGEIVETGTVKTIFEHPVHPVTKRFVKEISKSANMEKTEQELKQLYPNGTILRLIFDDSISDKPILASVIRQTKLPISIVNSHLTHSAVGTLGVMYIHIVKSDDEQLDDLIRLLIQQHVKVEVV